jgi:hypothetical protein
VGGGNARRGLRIRILDGFVLSLFLGSSFFFVSHLRYTLLANLHIFLLFIISYSIFFVLLFRCFFTVNYSYSNCFRTENVRFMRAGVLLGFHEAG